MSYVYFLIESRLRPVQLANCWQSAAKPRHVYIFNGHTYRSAENYPTFLCMQSEKALPLLPLRIKGA